MKNYLKSNPVNSRLSFSTLKTVFTTYKFNFKLGPYESLAAYS